jgi:predicted glycogen debranching enzyme
VPIRIDDRTEWLEADGLGGFASGTTSGVRTRRYHALLLVAATPPAGRFVLVNGLDATVKTPEGEFALSSHRYAPGVVTGSADVRVERFSCDPWPTWVYRLRDGTRIVHDLCVTHGSARAVATWRLLDAQAGVRLRIRPLMSGRDYHALHHENPYFRFEPQEAGSGLRWMPYPGVPSITIRHNGRYRHEPDWYRRFQYDAERERGFDGIEDLASPGVFEYDLAAGEAQLTLSAGDAPACTSVARCRAIERQRRAGFSSPLERAADTYLVSRAQGRTVIAGYPWFGDWGRDTFIAMRGLCLATGRLDDAREVLLSWAGQDSGGVLPNRFPDGGGAPEYNSVDASLWYIIAAHELMTVAAGARRPLTAGDQKTLRAACARILRGYSAGTHHGIHQDDDGLLAAGEPGVQLTWMDARVGERVITPRIGKPVEIQALWINALRIASAWEPRWGEAFERARRCFRQRFWNERDGCLYDVVDADHIPGRVDAAFRPNQVLAMGGLPLNLLSRERARRVLAGVEDRLSTPMGLRSLAPGEPGYAARYEGGPEQRDSVYHQGTVWPWLMGPFVEAWVRVRGDSAEARVEARRRFLEPMLAPLLEAGIGHISEVAHAEAPHTPGGCPFQAWSLGEALRLDRVVLAAPSAAAAGIELPVRPERIAV